MKRRQTKEIELAVVRPFDAAISFDDQRKSDDLMKKILLMLAEDSIKLRFEDK